LKAKDKTRLIPTLTFEAEWVKAYLLLSSIRSK